ncbi:hypothetical protein [Elizabethkingia meningoseptica]|uniref:hypothetical protein n=1 Tax=Elizabethkingia meningoseptica TaxID=238 RepID=UPI0008416671|nr:hypothetical protein [Elizabethkingia meningoseptica]ODM55187.1 hypothetical protein BES09_01665 [Elizabethkingia meningoseptica]OHT30392.1 hypothetical protein BFF93_01670 [Elizabethkingia meningoseptica]OPC12128.1 hypothetical protein BAX93_06455 [Elizabethkingia meningoseptica]
MNSVVKMQYLIILEYDTWGKILFSSEDYNETVSRYLRVLTDARKVKDEETWLFCAYRLEALLRYKISHWTNAIIEYLMTERTKFCGIYIIKCNGVFDHNKLKRMFSNYYSRQINTLDSFIHFELTLN